MPSTASSTSTPSPSTSIRTSCAPAPTRPRSTFWRPGLDPDRCTLFVQSQVAEHTRLTWLLECTATMGELGRMTQFKEKSAGRDSVRVGLFTYPVLQASDILLYDAERVPVGEDQRQHLELARELAQRFNRRFGTTFVVPEASIPPLGARVMDLQHPDRKMSKSVNSPLGTVLVLDEPAEILRKVKRAVTDTDGEVRYDPEAKPGLSNLLELLGVVTGRAPDRVGGHLHPLRRAERGSGRGARRAAPSGARATQGSVRRPGGGPPPARTRRREGPGGRLGHLRPCSFQHRTASPRLTRVRVLARRSLSETVGHAGGAPASRARLRPPK